MGGKAFFSLCVTVCVSAFLQRWDNQPPQHERPAATISHLSQFELLFTKKTIKTSPICKKIIFYSFTRPCIILNTNDFPFCVTQG